MIRNRRAGGDHHVLGVGDTRLHVRAGALKHLLVGHIANRLAVGLHIEHKGLVQTALNHIDKDDGRRHRQHIGQRVEHQRKIATGSADKIADLLLADLMGALVRQLLREIADVAQAPGHNQKRLGNILTQRDNSQRKGAHDGKKQRGDVPGDGAADFGNATAKANQNILHPEADHVQGIANHMGMGNPVQRPGH